MRHLTEAEIEGEALGTRAFGTYHGVVYNRQYNNATVDSYLPTLRGRGVAVFLYYSLLDFPMKVATISGPWYNWIRTNWQFNGPKARLLRTRGGSNVVALFRYYCISTPATEYRELISWDKVTAGYHAIALDILEALSPTVAGFFFDQTWQGMSSWMLCDQTRVPAQGACPPASPTCVSGHGDVENGTPKLNGATWTETNTGANWPLYTSNLSAFITSAEGRRVSAGTYTINNGDPEGPWPGARFLENSGLGGAIDPTKLAAWIEDKRNVLEIKLLPAPYPLGADFEALKETFREYGGWVAVNAIAGPLPGEDAEEADGANMMEAYRQLAEVAG